MAARPRRPVRPADHGRLPGLLRFLRGAAAARLVGSLRPGLRLRALGRSAHLAGRHGGSHRRRAGMLSDRAIGGGSKIRWEINRKRFHPVFVIALLLSIIGVFTFISGFGGILGIIKAYEQDQEAFVGRGWLLVLAWPRAVLTFIPIVIADH